MLNHRFLPVLSVSLLLSGAAFAQTADSTIEDRLGDYRPTGAIDIPLEESFLTGNNDLVLLKRHELFYSNLQAGYTHTNNAFLSNNRKDSDDVFDAAATLGASTRIAQTYDVFAEVMAFTSQYMDNSELSYNGYGARLGASRDFGVYNLGFTYGLTSVYDSDKHIYSDRQVTLHDFALNANRTFRFSADTALIPQLVLSRSFADPADYDSWQARGALSLVHVFRDDLVGALGTEVYYRSYDDFFESATLEKREDKGLRFTAAMNWELTDNLTASANVAFTRNDSTLGSSDYNLFNVSPGIRFSARF